MFPYQQLLILLFTEIYKHDQEGSIVVSILILIKIFETQSESKEREENIACENTEIILAQFRFLFSRLIICFCQTVSPFPLLHNCSSAVSYTI